MSLPIEPIGVARSPVGVLQKVGRWVTADELYEEGAWRLRHA